MNWYEDPVYIKMCEKAEKIQALWEINAWDWAYCRGAKGAVV